MPPACVVQVLRAIGNHMRVGSRLSVMTALRAPVGLMAGVGVVGVMTMMIGNRMRVGSRLSVMTAIRASVGVMIDDRDVSHMRVQPRCCPMSAAAGRSAFACLWKRDSYATRSDQPQLTSQCRRCTSEDVKRNEKQENAKSVAHE